jgi:23S rRNA (uracil1939-C5)-methyltransferase
MVCLVINGQKLPGEKDLVRSLRGLPGTGGQITSISLNINTARNNVILGDEVRFLYGDEYLEDGLLGLHFRIAPQSFYQVNPIQTEKLYRTALSCAGLTGAETVWDLYCGVGTISLCLADELRKKAAENRQPESDRGKVFGIEIIPQAIENAKENAALNGLSELTRFECGRAEELVPAMMRGDRDAFPQPDVIVVDPPRKGLDEACLQAILAAGPDRIVYVSCDPATLARDLKMLAAGGYVLQYVQPVDMFPETVHVETVCLLSKLSGSKNTIDVKVDMDELDVTSAETKATYEEIKAYVLEQTGLQVSNLYIAQVKRECGIIERENYNKAKSEDSRQPQCPEEKRKAIMEALEHFGMV